jgi:hypothetical protein
MASFATLVFATAAAAQSFDTRWQAWLGCWQPADAPASSGAAAAPVTAVCVSPIDAPSAVEVATIEDGKVTARDTIDASGAERRIDKEGCVGATAGRWSADNRRVFIHSTMTCDGGLARTNNAIVAMTPAGEWLDVHTLTVAKTTGVRAIHYRDANSLKDLPAEFADIDADRGLAIASARMAAGASLDVPAILEAVKQTDTSAVQAWIVERGTQFKLDAGQLVQLADAGVPPSVTDVMIGVSFPEHFALKEPGSSPPRVGYGSGVASNYDALYGYGSCAGAAMSMYGRNGCAPCGWGYGTLMPMTFDDCVGRYGYGYARSLYDPYYASPYSPLYGYYGGYGYGNYGYYAAPVVVVKGEQPVHGKVVNGRGYVRGGSGTSASSGSSRVNNDGARRTRSASSGSSSGRSSSSGSSGGSSSAGSSSSSSSSSGSSGTVRTAHPRPPV